jgi:hypothetical protein
MLCWWVRWEKKQLYLTWQMEKAVRLGIWSQVIMTSWILIDHIVLLRPRNWEEITLDKGTLICTVKETSGFPFTLTTIYFYLGLKQSKSIQNDLILKSCLVNRNRIENSKVIFEPSWSYSFEPAELSFMLRSEKDNPEIMSKIKSTFDLIW